MPASATSISALQKKVWSGSIPLEIRLAAADCRLYDQSDPYLVQPPRLSYLPFLLPRIKAFFASILIDPDVIVHEAWFSFDGVPLKWHYPLGLLHDLFSGVKPVSLDSHQAGDVGQSQVTVEAASGASPLPWRLTAHFSEYPGDQLIQLDAEGRALLDSFINTVKEADFIRNGTARTVMSLSKEDSDNLWRAVQTYDLFLFNSINNKLLNPPGMELRHIPIKVYLPTSATRTAADLIPEESRPVGHIRVVQSLVSLFLPTRQPQTLGTALNSILPSVFPSRRNPLLAQPVLHGVVVPMAAHLHDLSKAAAYPDGFLHVAVVMLA